MFKTFLLATTMVRTSLVLKISVHTLYRYFSSFVVVRLAQGVQRSYSLQETPNYHFSTDYRSPLDNVGQRNFSAVGVRTRGHVGCFLWYKLKKDSWNNEGSIQYRLVVSCVEHAVHLWPSCFSSHNASKRQGNGMNAGQQFP